MTKKKNYLTRSVVVTEDAYASLQRASQITGLPLGTLATLAIEQTFNPAHNAKLADALAESKMRFVEAISWETSGA